MITWLIMSLNIHEVFRKGNNSDNQQSHQIEVCQGTGGLTQSLIQEYDTSKQD